MFIPVNSPIINSFKTEQIVISDKWFWVNTKFTAVLLVLCSTLLGATNLIRKSIDCYSTEVDSAFIKESIEVHCFYSAGTYICANSTIGGMCVIVVISDRIKKSLNHVALYHKIHTF